MTWDNILRKQTFLDAQLRESRLGSFSLVFRVELVVFADDVERTRLTSSATLSFKPTIIAVQSQYLAIL